MFPLSREVGGRKLLVGTRLAQELAEFSGELSLEGLHFWKTVFSAMASTTTPPTLIQPQGVVAKTAKPSDIPSASDKKVVMLPCRNPPSRGNVQLWLEARRQYESLQKKVRGGAELPKVEPEGDEEPEKREGELCSRSVRRSKRRCKRRRLSLASSPSSSPADSPPNSPEVCLLDPEHTAEVTTKVKQDGGDAESPPSSQLPSWQQSIDSPSSQNRLFGGERGVEGGGIEGNTPSSPLELYPATPTWRRRGWRSKESLEPLCSTPISSSPPTHAAATEGEDLCTASWSFWSWSRIIGF